MRFILIYLTHAIYFAVLSRQDQGVSLYQWTQPKLNMHKAFI